MQTFGDAQKQRVIKAGAILKPFFIAQKINAIKFQETIRNPLKIINAQALLTFGQIMQRLATFLRNTRP